MLIVILLQGKLVFFFLSTFLLVLQDAPGLYCIIPVTVLESATSPGYPCSFYLTMILENNIRTLGVLLLQDQVTARKCMCIYIYE